MTVRSALRALRRAGTWSVQPPGIGRTIWVVLLLLAALYTLLWLHWGRG